MSRATRVPPRIDADADDPKHRETWRAEMTARAEAERARSARRLEAAKPPARRLVEALELRGCGYIDAETTAAVCPVCGGRLTVRDAGGRIGLDCHDGCVEADIYAAITAARRPRTRHPRTRRPRTAA